jgi:hypothetical protein
MQTTQQHATTRNCIAQHQHKWLTTQQVGSQSSDAKVVVLKRGSTITLGISMDGRRYVVAARKFGGMYLYFFKY